MRIDLTGYATDSIVRGALELRHDRLSDLLAEELVVPLADATLQALADGRLVRVAAVELRRPELALVAATGPRGNAGRRLATARRPLVAQVGPYEVVGRLHGPSPNDPFELLRRRPWVAVTEALVRYRLRGRPVAAHHPGVIINTALLAAIDGIDDIALELRLAAATAAARLDGPAPGSFIL